MEKGPASNRWEEMKERATETDASCARNIDKRRHITAASGFRRKSSRSPDYGPGPQGRHHRLVHIRQPGTSRPGDHDPECGPAIGTFQRAELLSLRSRNPL